MKIIVILLFLCALITYGMWSISDTQEVIRPSWEDHEPTQPQLAEVDKSPVMNYETEWETVGEKFFPVKEKAPPRGIRMLTNIVNGEPAASGNILRITQDSIGSALMIDNEYNDRGFGSYWDDVYAEDE